MKAINAVSIASPEGQAKVEANHATLPQSASVATYKVARCLNTLRSVAATVRRKKGPRSGARYAAGRVRLADQSHSSLTEFETWEALSTKEIDAHPVTSPSGCERNLQDKPIAKTSNASARGGADGSKQSD
jgi:hypothetical protein